MITLSQVKAAIDLQKHHLPPGGIARWAFLVTMEEIASLVDECQASGDPGMHMSALQAQHIKEGRAMLHIEGVAVLPELMQQPTQLDS